MNARSEHAAARGSAALGELIDTTPWIDTHEHLVEERHRLGEIGYRFRDGVDNSNLIPCDWSALLIYYALCDLVSAGLPIDVADAVRGEDLEPLAKWDAVAPYLRAARHTGYLRAVDISTERLFGLRLSRESCLEIDRAARDLRCEGYYELVLRDIANVERCHVNSVETDPYCQSETPELLQEDLSILTLVSGRHPTVEESSGIDVGDLDDYLKVIEWCFERYGAQAVAVKSQWAYQRSLSIVLGGEPPRVQFRRLRAGKASVADRRQVEDYLFCRCLDLAADWDLPVKLHLGYLDGNFNPQLRHIFHHPSDLAPVLQAYPRTQFVLMHAAWPQQEQLLALAKHQPNVVVDLCWAWIISPMATTDFVQRFLTTVPYTKLLCFGGDYLTVENVVGHAELARRGLQSALEGLVRCGWFGLDDAADLVPQLMRGNAQDVFSRKRIPETQTGDRP